MELSIEKWCDLSENPGEPHSYFRGLEHMPVQRPQTHVELVEWTQCGYQFQRQSSFFMLDA
jgi:hypothetical protein